MAKRKLSGDSASNSKKSRLNENETIKSKKFIELVWERLRPNHFPSAIELDTLLQEIDDVLNLEDIKYQEMVNNFENPQRPGFQKVNAADKIVSLFISEKLKLEHDNWREIDQQILAQSNLKDVKNGAFNMLCVHVGHGDCTIIKTPKGQVVMIDCGSAGDAKIVGAAPAGTTTDGDSSSSSSSSSSTASTATTDGDSSSSSTTASTATTDGDSSSSSSTVSTAPNDADDEDQEPDLGIIQRVADTINPFFDTKKVIDILILTHPDRDHYNMLVRVLGKCNVSITRVYHSNDFTRYIMNNTKDAIIRSVGERSSIKRVYLNTKGAFIESYNENKKAGEDKKIAVPLKGSHILEYLSGNGSIVIHQEDKCTISILASEVEAPGATIDIITNAASIVTLIETYDKKIIICGDATFVTEDFLKTKYGDDIVGIDIIRIGHHGSNRTSSKQDFTDYVKAQKVIVSAGHKNGKHHFPSLEVLKRFWPHVKDIKDQGHDLWYWVEQQCNKVEEDVPSYSNYAAPIHDQLRKNTAKGLTNKQQSAYINKDLWITGSNNSHTIIFEESTTSTTTTSTTTTSTTTTSTTTTSTTTTSTTTTSTPPTNT